MDAHTECYSGEDRRGAARLAHDSPFGLPYALALAGCLVLAVGPLTRAAGVGDGVVVPADGLLGAAAAVLAVAGGLSVLCWRLVGFAPALSIGCGLIVAGPLGIALDLALSDRPAAIGWWPASAAGIVALGCLGYATAQPPVDAGLHPGRVLGGALGLTVVLAVLLDAWNGWGVVDVTSMSHGMWVATSFAVAWLTVAAAATMRARHHDGRWLFAWVGLMALAWSFDALVAAVAAQAERPMPAGHVVLLFAGALCGLWGEGRELHLSFAAQRAQLLTTRVSAEVAEETARLAAIAARERAHEARNALLAIEGATRTLERHHDTLPPEARSELAEAVSAEIGRLQRLVAGEEAVRRPAPFGVAEALAPVITGARAQGMEVLVDIPASITAYGTWSALGEVVQNLLENARRHAPGSTVWVSAAEVDGRVQVRVADVGPGVPVAERGWIFERGARGSRSGDVAGSGLGLHISKRLMAEQDGDLWLDPTSRCGAEFVAELPAATLPLERAAEVSAR